MSGYLTLAEAAQRLGVEYKTVYWLVRNGELPAGKVGRVYRIRQEDLDTYFERQKQLIAEKARGLTPLEGLRCGACGKAIVSELSVGGKCEQCGKDICQACWVIKKARHCRSHPAETHGGAAATAEAPASQAGQKQGGATVEAEQQDNVADVIAQLRRDGLPVVTAEEAKLAEQAFLRAFAERLGDVEQLPDPISGREVLLRKARVKHDIEPTYKGGPNVPGNHISRFVLRAGGWGKPKTCIVLAGRFCSRAEVLTAQGYDAESLGAGELMALLNELGERRGQGECFEVVLLASPTGWTDEAAAMISDRHHGKAFRSRRMAVALCDLHAEEVRLDESDERLWAFWPILAPLRHAAEIARCVKELHDILLQKNSVSLVEAARTCKGDRSWVRSAFAELQGSESFTIDELPDVGLVISRPSV